MIEIVGLMSPLERAMAADLLGIDVAPVTIVQKAVVIDLAEAREKIEQKKVRRQQY
jgi:predicted nucleotidyltransferase